LLTLRGTLTNLTVFPGFNRIFSKIVFSTSLLP
jgi:hypothetical protein